MTDKREVYDGLDGKVEFVLGDEFANRRRMMLVHDREYLGLTGRIAVRLVEHFGVVAAKYDGEDSAGRSALVQQEPEEVVDRAVRTAELLVDRLRANGHIETVPSIRDAEE